MISRNEVVSQSTINSQFIMLAHYFLIALRNVLRQRTLAGINVLGLTLGISCFVLIVLFIQDELSYDRHHLNAQRIHRMTEVIKPAEHSSSLPFSVAPTIALEYPAMIEHAVRFFNLQAPTLTIDRGEHLRFGESRFFFVDSTVFNVFSFPFLSGDPSTALDEPNSVVITPSVVKKYFTNEDPMGKTLRFEGQHDLKVTGILAEVPKNSHLQFDFLASFSTVTAIQNGQKPEGWNWNPCWTYLLLTEGTEPEQLQARLPGFVEKYFPDNIRERTSLHLQPLTDIHLHSHLDYEMRPNSDIQYVYIFTVIAAFILLIACINYMNLTTARSQRRSREVGVKKVLGADRSSLIWQFLGESMVMSIMAVLLSIPLINLALPALNAFLDKSIAFNLVGNPVLQLSLAGTALLVGFLAGLYPAFMLSAFNPTQDLKNRFIKGGFDWTVFIRKALVGTQFVISIALIIGTLVVYRQLQYVQQFHLGFNKEAVVMINMFRSNLAPKYDDLKERFLSHHDVLSVTTSEDVLGSKCQTGPFKPEGAMDFAQFQRLMVGFDFVETFQLELAAGRSFQKEYRTDDSLAVMINESMVHHLGWGSPQEALGKGFTGRRLTQVVVGVLKDFHYSSLHSPIGPFILDIADNERQHHFFDRYLAVRIAPQNYSEAITHLETVWSQVMPDRPFEYFFMDDEINKLYRAEIRLSRIAGIFTVFALLVASIGLLGIATFVAESRIREIGIRKILGSSAVQIVALLSRELLKPVFVAVLIAWPLAWYALSQWLKYFAFSVSLDWIIFLTGALSAFLIAFVTISIQVLQAASLNPVDSLRSE